MSVLENRVLRALERLGHRGQGPKPNQSLACWNWALTAYRADGVDPDPFYLYVRGDIDRAALDAGVRAIPNVNIARLNHEQAELDGYRTLWTTGNNGHTFEDAEQTATKVASIETISTGMAKCVVRINGLTISAAKTDYQLCLHFPTLRRRENIRRVQAVERRRDAHGNFLHTANGGFDYVPRWDANNNPIYRDFYQGEIERFVNGASPSFQHWWLRIRDRTTVQTFPGVTTVIVPYNDAVCPNREEKNEYYKVVRFYIDGLHQEHVNIIHEALRQANGNCPPFTPFATRQAWQPDNNADRCFWCNTRFWVFTRKHHCRRCGLIFCDDCSSLTDDVNLPATRPGETAVAHAANQRVCLTCCTK